MAIQSGRSARSSGVFPASPVVPAKTPDRPARQGRNQHGPWARRTAQDRLTDRQRQIVRLSALGATQAAVGADLGVSRWTVRNHLSEAYAQYDVTCLVDLLRAMGWLRVPDAAS